MPRQGEEMTRKIKAKNAKTGEIIEVDIDSLKTGPIRHRSVPDSLLQRIRAVHASIRDVYEMTLEQFEIGFMRDAHPEDEVAAWERIAVAYEKVIAAMPTLDPKTVLRTLLAYSMGALTPEEQAEPTVKRIIGIGEGK